MTSILPPDGDWTTLAPFQSTASLVGNVFIDELLAAHAAYGDVLGITKPTAATTPQQPLDEPLRVLSQSIVAYALQIIAFAALPPGHVEEAKRALQPIDELRMAAGRRGSSSGVREEETGGDGTDGVVDPGAVVSELPVADG